jgi:hypothetical protein
MAGIKIAGAKEDADKRKEGLKSIVNAAIGLVVAISAFAIVNTITSQFGQTKQGAIGLPCTGKDTVTVNQQNREITRVGRRTADGGCQYVNPDGTTVDLDESATTN